MNFIPIVPYINIGIVDAVSSTESDRLFNLLNLFFLILRVPKPQVLQNKTFITYLVEFYMPNPSWHHGFNLQKLGRTFGP